MISPDLDFELSQKYLKLFDEKKMTLDQFKKAVRCKIFRMGAFYHIMDAEGQKVKFRPNGQPFER